MEASINYQHELIKLKQEEPINQSQFYLLDYKALIFGNFSNTVNALVCSMHRSI